MENRRVEFFWNRESVVEILIWVAVFLLLTVSSFPLDFYLSFSLSIVLLIGMVLLSLFNRKVTIPFFLSKERFFWTVLFTVAIIVLMTFVFSFLEERILYYFIDFFCHITTSFCTYIYIICTKQYINQKNYTIKIRGCKETRFLYTPYSMGIGKNASERTN